MEEKNFLRKKNIFILVQDNTCNLKLKQRF